jgi:hypothetical protein
MRRKGARGKEEARASFPHVHLAKRLHKESTCGIMRALINPDAQELSNDHHTAGG